MDYAIRLQLSSQVYLYFLFFVPKLSGFLIYQYFLVDLIRIQNLLICVKIAEHIDIYSNVNKLTWSTWSDSINGFTAVAYVKCLIQIIFFCGKCKFLPSIFIINFRWLYNQI